MVITESAFFLPATAEDCRALDARLGPGWRVVYDANAALEGYGTNDLVVVLNAGGQVVFKRQGAPMSAVEAAIEEVLGSP